MSLLDQLLVPLPPVELPGEYDEDRQIWDEECAAALSPQKFNQEN